MRRPLIIGAALLFGASGCGDTDYSEPDPDEPAATNNGDTVSSNSSTTSSSNNAATTLAGAACDAPGEQICDLDQAGVLQCDGTAWRTFTSSAEYGCDCYQGQVQCWAAGFVGLRSSARPQPLRPLRHSA